MKIGDKIVPNQDEVILPDEYPVFWDFIYIVDDKVIKSDIQGTVKDLKFDLKGIEVRKFDFSRVV